MTIKRSSAFISILLTSLLFVSFQNCSGISSPVTFREESSGKVDESEGNGGQPYDGKVYVSLGSACPDLSTIQSRVVLKNSTSGFVVRRDCEEIKPQEIGANDFQIDPNDSQKLVFQGKAFGPEALLPISEISSVTGFAYTIPQDFGTTPDSREDYTISRLKIFENGIEMGPAHSWHADIQDSGAGRFSHWMGLSQTVDLIFSSSDNTDPRTNGRKYTYVISP